jgi:hypothetical protein
MSWIQITKRIFKFTGQIAKAEGFDEWADSIGKEYLETVIVKNDLKGSGKYQEAKTIIKNEIADKHKILDHLIILLIVEYQNVFKELALHIQDLPRSNQFPPFVKLIPRLLIDYTFKIKAQFIYKENSALNNLTYSEIYRSYILNKLMNDFSEVLLKHNLTISQNIDIGDNWFIIGKDDHFTWSDELPGHFYVYKLSSLLNKYDAKEAESKLNVIKDLTTNLSSPLFDAILNKILNEWKVHIKELTTPSEPKSPLDRIHVKKK